MYRIMLTFIIYIENVQLKVSKSNVLSVDHRNKYMEGTFPRINLAKIHPHIDTRFSSDLHTDRNF